MHTSSRISFLARGFTLIELLVVIAIIGILSGIILTSLTDARDKSRLASAMATMKNIQQGINLCLNDPAVFACMPGSNSAPCNASATGDTQSGGGGIICTTNQGNYVSLPIGWLFCDTTSGGGCGTTLSVANTLTVKYDYVLRAKRTADSMILQCKETGCTCVPGTGAACPAP